MKNFEISEKVQKFLREREVVFQSSHFWGMSWQELLVAKPDTVMGERFVKERRGRFSFSFNEVSCFSFENI